MYGTLIPAQIPPGGFEIVIVLLVLVLLFGANKIPKLARSTGQAMGEFKRGREEIEEELQDVRGGSDSGASIDESPATSPEPDTETTADAGADAESDAESETETETEASETEQNQ